MTVVYRDSDLDGLLTAEAAVEALEEAFRLEAEELTTVPGRLNAATPGGWIRLMPASINVDGHSAVAFKAMNLNQGTGVRYVTLLYDAESGELEAIMDAARMTRLRTAAVTAIACRSVRSEPLRELGLFGSGHEAIGHAEVFSALFPELHRIVVHSPSPERRERFADRMTSELGITVEPVIRPQDAAALPVVILATKAREVVTHSEWFAPGTLVLSIGSTRLDLRELDERAFARTRWCLADAPEQLAIESGDVTAALQLGVLQEEQVVRLSDVVARRRHLDWPPEDLLIFKSVGTALQDLAVSRAAHLACQAAGRGLDLGRFPIQH